MLLEDLQWFLPGDKAKAALAVLDVDGDGQVSMQDMRDAVVSIYRQRKNLALTLKVLLSTCLLPMLGECMCTLARCPSWKMGCPRRAPLNVVE